MRFTILIILLVIFILDSKSQEFDKREIDSKFSQSIYDKINTFQKPLITTSKDGITSTVVQKKTIKTLVKDSIRLQTLSYSKSYEDNSENIYSFCYLRGKLVKAIRIYINRKKVGELINVEIGEWEHYFTSGKYKISFRKQTEYRATQEELYTVRAIEKETKLICTTEGDYLTNKASLSLKRNVPISKDSQWLIDVNEAVAKAKREGKLIFIEFTGSDWCGPCMRLKKNVFNKDEFKKYASDNLVLLEVDFPRRRVLPASIKEQNKELQEKFFMVGYPNMVLVDYRLDKSARYYESAGYLGKDVSEYLSEIKESAQYYTHKVNIHSAFKKKDLDILQYFINERGINTLKNGKTLLMIAAEQGDKEIAKYLISKGSNKGTKNKKGETAYDIAKKKGNIQLATFLKPAK